MHWTCPINPSTQRLCGIISPQKRTLSFECHGYKRVETCKGPDRKACVSSGAPLIVQWPIQSNNAVPKKSTIPAIVKAFVAALIITSFYAILCFSIFLFKCCASIGGCAQWKHMDIRTLFLNKGIGQTSALDHFCKKNNAENKRKETNDHGCFFLVLTGGLLPYVVASLLHAGSS